MRNEHFDVLIVGAGLSGIGAADILQRESPDRTYAILEARERMGGTWDLFRYPGIRSDSDMHTLGYRRRPWTEAKAIADGPSIRAYIERTARAAGVDRHVRYGHRVVRASWSTDEARWTVEVERADSGERGQLTCAFLYGCTGYYRYDEGFSPRFAGTERFRGPIVHPQHWPEDLGYAGKRVVVIGSGATAVTLVPALAATAAHVTMLQRSPTYIVAVPEEDPVANWLRRRLPEGPAYAVTRWKNVAMTTLSYRFARRFPRAMRRLVRWGVVRQLPEGYDVDTHFKPRYDPWDQRLCMVPDGDLFRAIRHGRASVVTDRIETFTETGIRLASGRELEADVVVTATGLNLLVFGGIEMEVDGERVDPPKAMTYKGMMLSGVPNFAFALGYTNASWTLKADLTSEHVARLLNHMRDSGSTVVVPERDPSGEEHPLLDFQAGYVLRSLDRFPKQGSRPPWRMRQSYPQDLVALRYGRVDDEGLRFSAPARRLPVRQEDAAAAPPARAAA